MTSTVLLKRGKNDGIAIYVLKGAILKEITAKIKLSQHFFFDLIWELSDRTSYDLCVLPHDSDYKQGLD
jgi:hypothetical protein